MVQHTEEAMKTAELCKLNRHLLVACRLEIMQDLLLDLKKSATLVIMYCHHGKITSKQYSQALLLSFSRHFEQIGSWGSPEQEFSAWRGWLRQNWLVAVRNQFHPKAVQVIESAWQCFTNQKR